MKLLHLTFHRGCGLELEYVFTTLGHQIETVIFTDSDITGQEVYKLPHDDIYVVTHEKAQRAWDRYKDYYHSFDGIVISDSCPISRTFLQNNWSEMLIIWVPNRFDYAMKPEDSDPEYYRLLRDIPNRPNVTILGNTAIENIYCNRKRVDIGDYVIKPIGKNLIARHLFKKYDNRNKDTVFYVPPYHNEIKMMNLSRKLTSMGIQNKSRTFIAHWIYDYAGDIADLLTHQAVICIPYAWLTIAFFERLQLGMVTFLPSARFLLELFKSYGNYWFQPPFDIKNPRLELSEWYNDDHKDVLVYFDSWEDLAYQVEHLDYEEQSRIILEFARQHEKQQLAKWDLLMQRYCKSGSKEPALLP